MLIDRKEILPQAFYNEEFTKGVITGWTNMEPNRLQALNETTFLVTFAVGILAEEIGIAIEKVDNWLGKPVFITCNEVTMQYNFLMCSNVHNVSVELIWLFLILKQMIYTLTDYRVFLMEPCSWMTSPVPLKTVGQPPLDTIPGISQFSGTKREKDTVQFEQWCHAILDAHRNFSEPLVRAAITKILCWRCSWCHVLFAPKGLL